MKRLFAGALAASMLLLSVSACDSKTNETNASETTAVTGSESSVSESETETSVEDTTATEATTTIKVTEEEQKIIDLASTHGLTADDIRGEYELFKKYSETLDSNPNLDGIRELLYQVFPVVADNTAYMDEEYFFTSLESLKVEKGATFYPDDNVSYSNLFNTIVINEEVLDKTPDTIVYELYHHMMHYLDKNLSDTMDKDYYLLDGKKITWNEFMELSSDDSLRAEKCPTTTFIYEGGAEYLTTEYFTGAPAKSSFSVALFTGMEYVLGEDYMIDLYMSPDTDEKFEKLMGEIGYSIEDTYKLEKTISHITNPRTWDSVEDKGNPQDMLIDLYEYKLGDGWKEDDQFLYILKVVGLEGGNDIAPSSKKDNLPLFNADKDWYKEFELNTVKNIAEKPINIEETATPFMKDGKFLIGIAAMMSDPTTGEGFYGVASYDINLKLYEVNDYEVNSFKGLASGYIDADAISGREAPGEIDD